MFSVHTTPEKFENATITGHLNFCLRKLEPGNHMIIVVLSFSKSSDSKCFPSKRKRKAGVFKVFRIEERFQKAPFS